MHRGWDLVRCPRTTLEVGWRLCGLRCARYSVSQPLVTMSPRVLFVESGAAMADGTHGLHGLLILAICV